MRWVAGSRGGAQADSAPHSLPALCPRTRVPLWDVSVGGDLEVGERLLGNRTNGLSHDRVLHTPSSARCVGVFLVAKRAGIITVLVPPSMSVPRAMMRRAPS